MNSFKNFKTGIIQYREAIIFIKNNRLSYYFIYPLILNVILFYFGWNSVNILINYCQEYIESISQLDSIQFWGREILQKAIDIILYLFFKMLFVVMFAYIGGYIIIILLSPVFAMLSEKIEQIKTGKEYPFSLKQNIKDIITGTSIAIRNLCYEILITVVLIFFGFIPIVGWLSVILLLIVSSYFYGFSFHYYSLERKRFSKRKNIKFMKNNKELLTANGLIFASCLMIPFVGIVLSSFVAILSTVAASISIHEKLD